MSATAGGYDGCERNRQARSETRTRDAQGCSSDAMVVPTFWTRQNADPVDVSLNVAQDGWIQTDGLPPGDAEQREQPPVFLEGGIIAVAVKSQAQLFSSMFGGRTAI